MECENCGAKVPEIYQGADGRQYCCAGCLFHPNGCRCKFGEFGIVQDDLPCLDFDDEDFDDEDFDDEDFDDDLGQTDISICAFCLEVLDQYGKCVYCDL